MEQQATLGKIINLTAKDTKKTVKMAENEDSDSSSVNFNDDSDENIQISAKEKSNHTNEQAEHKTASVSNTISHADAAGV